jgi:hypothetical protein
MSIVGLDCNVWQGACQQIAPGWVELMAEKEKPGRVAKPAKGKDNDEYAFPQGE